MVFEYKNIDDFEKNYDNYEVLDYLNKTKCDCGAYYEMYFDKVEVIIGKYAIVLEECPIMLCSKCGEQHLCPNIPQEIYIAYFQLLESDSLKCKMTMKSDIRYEFAKDANYIYDSRDMSIPGLGVDLDPTNPKGFSCPVYFERKVLNNFFTDDDYELDFFSESYGSIAKKGTDGWEYEWKILFGVNRNDKVILFLGDLHQIESDDRAVYWLKSYNIPSDHCIIDTELYRGQINCMFSEPIIEHRIIALRNSFFSKIKKKYGIELFHLEKEVEDNGKDLNKPINYSKREIKENIITLDGVLNEGIDCNALRTLCSMIVTPPPTNINELKTRKLLQNIIAVSSGQYKAKDIIAPLFYLNDLRVCFAHLIPRNEIEKYKENIVSAFELTSFTDYRKLYDTLIDKLYYLYRYLNITEI